MGVSIISSVLPVLKARLLVGFLGERAHFGWWSTAYYESSAHLFLEPIFPKTSHVAQYHGVVEAARILHDEHLNVGTYHLFRLPEEMEQDLHKLMQDRGKELSPAVLYQDKQGALAVLSDVAGSAKKDGVGPVSIGNVENVVELLKDVASVYRSAFLSGVQSFPYFARSM